MKLRTFAMPAVVLAALLVPFLVTGCGDNSARKAEAPKPTLRYAAIPDQNTTELAQRFAPLTDYLSTKLGVPVEYVPARDYQACVEMFRNGDIDLAWFGGLTGVQARAAVPGAHAIAQGGEDPTYYSYFIANAATGLQESGEFPREIGGLAFTFGSESSTSGRLMPEYFIRQATGQAPGEFFSQPFGFSGSHDKTCELVAAGRFQAGVVNYKVYERRVKEGTTDPAVVRVIWRTPTYADYNFTAHPQVDTRFGAGFTQRLQDALTGITDTSLLAALPRESLIPARDEEYAGIAEVARELGMVR